MSRILIVDDEPGVTDGLVALLEMQSIEAAGAYDREAAEELIAAEFFPLIIADLRLRTEEDGIRLLESIRRLSPGSRVATLTGYATEESETRVRELGSSMILRKSEPLDEIVETLAGLLREIESAEAEEPVDAVQVESLYERMRNVLFAIPQKRYGLTSDEAEDLVQQAWCLYLERRGGVQNAAAWLAGTVTNLSKQQIQRNRRTRRQRTSDDELREVPVDGGGDALLIVHEALARVDTRSRELCRLIAVEGCSYEEVSAKLGVALGSVGPLYIRAKGRLRKAMLS
ncbi:MAG TPA: sigma-70 family RNA polymerase sigma factor [Thermoanaerobaculia bacterium]|nr:sigma-70 family RNA polymerase sigma factor [Thermoanaerobaculia bacterium]